MMNGHASYPLQLCTVNDAVHSNPHDVYEVPVEHSAIQQHARLLGPVSCGWTCTLVCGHVEVCFVPGADTFPRYHQLARVKQLHCCSQSTHSNESMDDSAPVMAILKHFCTIIDAANFRAICIETRIVYRAPVDETLD
jgi:hypothetical protein